MLPDILEEGARDERMNVRLKDVFSDQNLLRYGRLRVGATSPCPCVLNSSAIWRDFSNIRVKSSAVVRRDRKSSSKSSSRSSRCSVGASFRTDWPLRNEPSSSFAVFSIVVVVLHLYSISAILLLFRYTPPLLWPTNSSTRWSGCARSCLLSGRSCAAFRSPFSPARRSECSAPTGPASRRC